jgi:hypothetical protein
MKDLPRMQPGVTLGDEIESSLIDLEEATALDLDPL